MSTPEELIQQARLFGVEIAADPPDLVIRPRGVLPADLREQIGRHRAAIYRFLEARRLETARQESADIRRVDLRRRIGISAGVLGDGTFVVTATLSRGSPAAFEVRMTRETFEEMRREHWRLDHERRGGA